MTYIKSEDLFNGLNEITILNMAVDSEFSEIGIDKIEIEGVFYPYHNVNFPLYSFNNLLSDSKMELVGFRSDEI